MKSLQNEFKLPVLVSGQTPCCDFCNKEALCKPSAEALTVLSRLCSVAIREGWSLCDLEIQSMNWLRGSLLTVLAASAEAQFSSLISRCQRLQPDQRELLRCGLSPVFGEKFCRADQTDKRKASEKHQKSIRKASEKLGTMKGFVGAGCSCAAPSTEALNSARLCAIQLVHWKTADSRPEHQLPAAQSWSPQTAHLQISSNIIKYLQFVAIPWWNTIDFHLFSHASVKLCRFASFQSSLRSPGQMAVTCRLYGPCARATSREHIPSCRSVAISKSQTVYLLSWSWKISALDLQISAVFLFLPMLPALQSKAFRSLMQLAVVDGEPLPLRSPPVRHWRARALMEIRTGAPAFDSFDYFSKLIRLNMQSQKLFCM